MLKLSVGVKEVAQLRAIQARRALTEPPLRHQTRMTPKRREELVDGGSIFWVIAGLVQVRQRLLDIVPDHREDGTTCAALVLDPVLVPVSARPVKAFQGWRYMDAASAPPDVEGRDSEALAQAGGAMPAQMLRELQALGLL